MDAAILALNQTLEVASTKHVETAAPSATSPSWLEIQKNADFKAAITKFGFTVKGEIRSGSSSLGIALGLKNLKGSTAKTALRKAAALERVLSTKIHKDLKVLESGVSKNGVFTPVFAVGYTVTQTQMALQKALESHVASVLKIGKNKVNTKMKVEPNRAAATSYVYTSDELKRIVAVLKKLMDSTLSRKLGLYLRNIAKGVKTKRKTGKDMLRELEGIAVGGKSPFQHDSLRKVQDAVAAAIRSNFTSALRVAQSPSSDVQKVAAYLQRAGELIEVVNVMNLEPGDQTRLATLSDRTLRW
ncbi:hypothetical protein [Rhizobium phage RHEph12]|nr:hypothetical protein [Rhizobium phage RHEph12]